MPRSEQGAPGRFRLGPHQRLRDPADFQRVYAARQVWAGPVLRAYVRSSGLPIARLGVSVGRKHGNAAQRNRLKRVLREAFRLARSQLPAGCDYVLIPQPGAAGCKSSQMQAELTRLGRRMKRKGALQNT